MVADLPDEVTSASAKASPDRFCERVTTNAVTWMPVGPLHCRRSRRGRATTPGPKGTADRGRDGRPAGHPAGADALPRNRYSLPPDSPAPRVGATTLAIVASSGVTDAVHRRRADGARATERTDTHMTALNTAAMTATSSVAPHRSMQRIRPGQPPWQRQKRCDNNISSSAEPLIDLTPLRTLLGYFERTLSRLGGCFTVALIVVRNPGGGELVGTSMDVSKPP